MKIVLPEDYREVLADLPSDVETAWYRSLEEALTATAGADAMWFHLDPRHASMIVEAEPRLRWLSTVGAGMDRWPLTQLRARDLVITNGAGIAAIPIAEYTIACMLAAGRGLRSIFASQAKSEWDPGAAGARELFGSRALIVGYGSIGRAIGQRLQCLGVEVVGARRRPDSNPDIIAGDAWRARLGEFDWVILANPLTSETRHQLGTAEIAAMKPGAWVVNVSRGALIDDTALIPALRTSHLGGAILDAFETEPLPSESEYWRLPNVIVTPHISWKTTRSRARAAAMFKVNLERFRRGESLLNVVDLSAGY